MNRRQKNKEKENILLGKDLLNSLLWLCGGIQISQKLLWLLATSFCLEFIECLSCKPHYVVLLRKKTQNVPLINNCSLEQSRKQDHYFQLTDFSRSRIITKEILHKRLWENLYLQQRQYFYVYVEIKQQKEAAIKRLLQIFNNWKYRNN